MSAFGQRVVSDWVRSSWLRATAWAFTVGLSVGLAACSSEPPPQPISPAAIRSLDKVSVSPAAAVVMLNAYRAQHGLGSVRLDPALDAMAQQQADAMVRANEMSHDVGGSFTTRLARAGVEARSAAENVGAGYYSLEAAFAGWRASSGHNANLLLPAATRFGIALAKDPRTRYRVYWSMEMASD